jgi:hypothetical protein
MNDTSHTIQQTIKIRALRATIPSIAGMNFPINSRDWEMSFEMEKEGATEMPSSPTKVMLVLGVPPRSWWKLMDASSASTIERSFM